MAHVIVMGVSGSGKSTIGVLLAQHLGWLFKDADDFHPPANVAKMSRGEALNDEDRAPWLAAIGQFIDSNENVVVTCSALKRRYRDNLKGTRQNGLIVYLEGSEELIFNRMQSRKGHFMPLSLLKTQFLALEPPQNDEAILRVSIDNDPQEIARIISSHLHRLA